MIDMEKVIKVYEDFVNGYECFCTSDDYEYEMHKAVLFLLKEQQQQIWELQDQVEYLTDKKKEQKFLVDSDGKITPLPVVVRCKDCKHFSFKEYWADIGHGAKILATDHCPTCDKWADGGCKTDPEGFCFLAERVDT